VYAMYVRVCKHERVCAYMHSLGWRCTTHRRTQEEDGKVRGTCRQFKGLLYRVRQCVKRRTSTPNMRPVSASNERSYAWKIWAIKSTSSLEEKCR